MNLIDRVKRFQEYLLELGVSRGVISTTAPRMSLAINSSDSSDPVVLYANLITEEAIISVSRDLFASGHYSLSVQEAYKAVEKYIASKSGKKISSATSLMESVFSPTDPVLFWSERANQSQKDEQAGYHRLYAGAMLGIRNPITHEFNWIQDGEVALELLCFAQHLLRKAKLADVAKISKS